MTKLTKTSNNIDIKKYINKDKRVLVFNPKKEIIYDSEILKSCKVNTPKTNTIMTGTVKEIESYIKTNKLIREVL